MALIRSSRGAGRASLALAALAACGDPPMVIAPVIDTPISDPDATATQLDEITLTVAHQGSDQDLVSQTFASGDPLELPGVPFGDDLVIHMSGFVGASNVAYGRTCEVEVSSSSPTPTPHLFFSRSVKFASLAIAPIPRFNGLGISYLGTGLFVGGDTLMTGGSPLNTVEKFDPLTGQLTVVGNTSPRDGMVTALLGTSPPRAAIIGGADFIELVDDQRIDQIDTAGLGLNRTGMTATALTDGRVIVVGGIASTQPPTTTPTSEIDQIEQGADLTITKVTTAPLAHPRTGHTATRLGDDVGASVLIAGGADNNGTIDIAELFKPLSGTLSSPASFAPKMNFPRTGHTASLMPDGSVLFIGGVDANNQPVVQMELFSIDAGFVPVGPLPDGAAVVGFTATTLPDGRILLTGGTATPGPTATPLNNAFIARLDPASGQVDVVPTDHLAIARTNHQATLLCDGTVLITGGTAGQFPAERYNPPPTDRR